MRLLLLRFGAEIRVARAPFLLASAACRGVPATRAGGPSVAKNNRRRVPFRVPTLVLVAQRRRRWRGPPAGTPRFAPLVLDGALSRARFPYDLIRVLRLGEKRNRGSARGGALARVGAPDRRRAARFWLERDRCTGSDPKNSPAMNCGEGSRRVALHVARAFVVPRRDMTTNRIARTLPVSSGADESRTFARSPDLGRRTPLSRPRIR